MENTSIIWTDIPRTQESDVLIKQMALKTNLLTGQIQLTSKEEIPAGMVIGLFKPILEYKLRAEDLPATENEIEDRYNWCIVYANWAHELLTTGYPDFMNYMFPRTETCHLDFIIKFLVTHALLKYEMDVKSCKFQLFCGLFFKLSYNHRKSGIRSGSTLAIYRSLSFVDHACCSNCDLLYTKANNTLMLRAMMYIHKGEPLTISYIPKIGKMSADLRKSNLLFEFGFSCQCFICEVDKRQLLRCFHQFKVQKSCFSCGKPTQNMCHHCSIVPFCNKKCYQVCDQHSLLCDTFILISRKEKKIVEGSNEFREINHC